MYKVDKVIDVTSGRRTDEEEVTQNMKSPYLLYPGTHHGHHAIRSLHRGDATT